MLSLRFAGAGSSWRWQRSPCGVRNRLSARGQARRDDHRVPVEVRDAQGQIVRQPIKVTIFRDDARPRAPFMILNHGRSAKAVQRAGVKPAQYAANARYFVSRGYAVFMPVRIGYGASGGADVENSGPCAAKAYRRVYEAGTTQSLSVIEFAKAQPYVDPARGIVVGQSFGGTITIALAARNVPGVLAGVNFAGGGGGRPDTHPDQPCSVERMTQLFASYGATARIPTLWVYSRNDKFWGRSSRASGTRPSPTAAAWASSCPCPSTNRRPPSFTGAPEA
jgi:dienelactone hydrolase